MTGLEKIINQIKSESDQAAAKILENAAKEVSRIQQEADAQALSECKKIAAESASAVADRKARAASAVDLQKRKTLLAQKQALIAQVIETAKQRLTALPDNQYFEVILKMVTRFALPQSGEILFSQKDMERLPADFETALNEAAKARGGKLKISGETRNIDGGFVLVYGGVEENCSFTALFESQHEMLQDKVQNLLFK